MNESTGNLLLILDEDVDHANAVAEVAAKHGDRAVIANNPAEFRDSYSAEVNILVIDLMMSSEDGIRLIRELSEKGCTASLVIIGDTDRRILSAAERLARARRLNVAGVLPKPVNEFGLRRLLDRTTARPGGKGRHIDLQLASTELSRCMDDGSLELVFQPKIDVRTLEFVSVETLVRLDHPEHGLLEPSTFLVLAEESGLIGQLTRAVVLKALEQVAAWSSEGLALQIAINISPLLLTDLDLPERFAKIADSHAVDPENIVLEITESWASQDDVAALDILTRLRMKGFHLSIDDFGTGYSTMAQLNELPYSEMKLDQSFIRNAARDAEARAIVESSIDLGHKLGMRVVAEGIERQEDWDLISDLRCDEGQGYFIARPMRADRIPGWLSHWNSSLGRT